MKRKEANKSAVWTFRDDEDDAFHQLALLKERADYRAWFTPERRKAFESAWSRNDEDATIIIYHFDHELSSRFGINYPPHDLDLLDPRVDLMTIPARVRQVILPDLFYKPSIREVVPNLDSRKGRGEAPRRTTSSDCAPYERLYKIDLRKKPSLLLKEFEAVLKAVEAHRGMKPEEYEAWKQDRSRKREEAKTQLEVWRLRRQRKGFSEIARLMKMNVSTVKMSFRKAYEMIEKRRYNRDDFRRSYWEIRNEELKRTCKTCPDRKNCTVLCPDVLPFINQDIRGRRELIVGGTIEVLPRDGRKRPHLTMDKQESRMRTRKDNSDPS